VGANSGGLQVSYPAHNAQVPMKNHKAQGIPYEEMQAQQH